MSSPSSPTQSPAQPNLPPPRLLNPAPALTRPLALIDHHAYAAAWPLTTTTTTTTRWDPQTQQHRPLPDLQTHLRPDLLVLRDDGRAFGPGGDEPLTALGPQPRFPVLPPPDRQWSLVGLTAYRAAPGDHPDPAQVFNQIADVIDAFVDFERSLGPQRLMAEFFAVFVLSTWLSDAFHTLGFLWLTGEHRRAPVQLLHTLTRLAHLGVVAPSGALTSTLRGLAALGATLAFDETDALAAYHPGDPAWRSWLLAGSHRGASTLTREYDPDQKQWRALPVSAFCPRLFASTHLPAARLAGQTIVVPLVPTADRARLLRHPHDPVAWPHPLPTLQDDLYALALACLPALPAYDRQVPSTTRVPPSGLDPWRAILAVARWLSDHGVPGLFDRLDALAVSYQTERYHLETDDFTLLLIRALFTTFTTFSTTAKGGPPPIIYISTQDVISAAQFLHDYTSAFDRRELTPNRVGRFLRRLRLPDRRLPHANSANARVWGVTLNDLHRWSAVYGLPLPESLALPAATAPPLAPPT